MSDSEKHNFLSVTISALLLASASMRYVAHFLSKNVVIFYDFHLEKLFTAVQKDNLHVFRNLNCPLYLVLPFYTHRPLGFTLGFSKSNVHLLSFQALFRRIFSLVLNIS